MYIIYFRQLLTFTFIGFLAVSCKDSVSHDHEDHTNADGFILEDESGNEIYREFEGASSDSVIISIGQTLEISVHFLDHDGNEIEHDEEEDGHGHDEEEEELRISENDSAIATIEVKEHCDEITNQSDCEATDHCEWHSDEAKCADEVHDEHDHSEEEEHHGIVIHITGVSVGSTSFKLELMHGNHVDYTSIINVPIFVTASN